MVGVSLGALSGLMIGALEGLLVRLSLLLTRVSLIESPNPGDKFPVVLMVIPLGSFFLL